MIRQHLRRNLLGGVGDARALVIGQFRAENDGQFAGFLVDTDSAPASAWRGMDVITD